MERYTVLITEGALADMQEIYDYIRYQLGSSINAENQYNRIADAILGLESFPLRYKVMDNDLGETSGFRRMPVDNYSVFFFIKDDSVIVTNVLYGRSDIEKRLK